MTPESASQKGSSYLQSLLGLIAIVAVLYLAKTVIVPLALAILLTFILTPIVIAIQRRGPNRITAVAVVVLCTFVLFGVIGWGVVVQVRTLAKDLPTHTEEIQQKMASLRGSGGGTFDRLLQMGRDIFGEQKEMPSSEPNENAKPVSASYSASVCSLWAFLMRFCGAF